MKSYSLEKDGPCCAPELAEDNKKRYPTGYIKVPQGMTDVALGDKVDITIRGVVKGFSSFDYSDNDEIQLELHEAEVKKTADGAEFSELADD